MTEIDKKRGWWARIVGADEGRTPEEVIQQLARELGEARELAERLLAERDALRVECDKRAREDAALAARARTETDQVRRAAETQLGALRAQLEALRKEQGDERASREQKLREAAAKERELRAALSTIQRDTAILMRDLAGARQATTQEQAKTTHLNEDLVATRGALMRAEQELAKSKAALASLTKQHDETSRATRKATAELAEVRRITSAALSLALGQDGAELALVLARRVGASPDNAPGS